MAELGIVEDNFSGTEDPLAESTPDIGSEDSSITPSAEAEGQDPAEAEQPEFIEGTSFKDQASLVAGYKNIQKLAQQKDDRLKQVEQQLQMAARQIEYLMASAQKTTAPKAPELPLEGEAYWQQFSKDPVGTVQQIADRRLQEQLKKTLGPEYDQMKGQFAELQRENLVRKFVQANPEFKPEDEDAVVQMLQRYPQMQQMPDFLQVAYDRVVAERWRTQQSKAASTQAVAGAKSIAGLGGKKSSAPVQAKTGDPFDEVLDADKAERTLYKLGR